MPGIRWPTVDVVIPALNERQSLPDVIADLPKNSIRHLVVVDNGSDDGTEAVARAAGARVVVEPRRGYGSACLAGIKAASEADLLVFLDGDGSDDPRELKLLLERQRETAADLVIGSRALGKMEQGAMMPQQIFGNWLATNLIRFFYNYRFTDLGPFRAIKWQKLQELEIL